MKLFELSQPHVIPATPASTLSPQTSIKPHCGKPMRKPLMRIPYTGPLPAPRILPRNANTTIGAVAALSNFLIAPPAATLDESTTSPNSTVALTGAGISVASGLADYRGDNGTYRVNKMYRPIYYDEFLQNHEARKRYWARSFLGWPNLDKAEPNATHRGIRDLGQLGLIKSVVTQNVDSFHLTAHPELPALELHGYLRALRCTSCHNELPRDIFQKELARLNPAWAELLEDALASGALDSEYPERRRAKGMKLNPDGDVDLPGAPYTTFRYPACPTCLANPPITTGGARSIVNVDGEGGFEPSSTAGILKPAVVMFGESIAAPVKAAAEHAIDSAGRLLIIGTSLATYSAWRLARRAKDRGMPIAIVNLGGVRGEEVFFEHIDGGQRGELGVRAELSSDKLIPSLVDHLRTLGIGTSDSPSQTAVKASARNNNPFKDMLS
jgi:NAD-dependent deacetylase sirtuin 4